jgi:hypothetical protein
MVGAGTFEDPRRPLYAPAPGTEGDSGIVGFSYDVSDDGNSALVELVAVDRAAFTPMLEDKRADVKVFEKSKAKKEDVEKEWKKYKPKFDPDKFGREGRVHLP